MNKTLRDEIAIEAMKCLMTDESLRYALGMTAIQQGIQTSDAIAQAAYGMANSMLKAGGYASE